MDNLRVILVEPKLQENFPKYMNVLVVSKYKWEKAEMLIIWKRKWNQQEKMIRSIFHTEDMRLEETSDCSADEKNQEQRMGSEAVHIEGFVLRRCAGSPLTTSPSIDARFAE